MKGFMILGLLISPLTHAFTTVSLDSNGYVSKSAISINKSNLTKISNKTSSFKGLNTLASSKRVFGDYLRDRVYSSSNIEQRTIGQMDQICTGTLVSPKHVITAAHCVYNVKDGTWVDRNSFSAGRVSQNDSPNGTVSWKKAYILEEYMNTGKATYDFAIVELKEELGSNLGWKAFGYNNALEDNSIGRINGYPGDKPPGTAWKVECPLTFYEREITHRCDTYGGMSGSAIRQTDSDGDDVIYGIHTYGGSNFNGGARINPETFNILQSWVDDSRTGNDIVRNNNVPTQNYDKIYFENECNRTIWTTLHYKDLNDEWVTGGWWKLAPHQKGYVADTRNVVYYIHGESEDGNYSWNGDYNFRVNGNGPYSFSERRIQTEEWGEWTQIFSCN